MQKRAQKMAVNTVAMYIKMILSLFVTFFSTRIILNNLGVTDFGIYPPIDVLSSASRVSSDIITEEHKILIQKFRRYYALLKENEILIRIGSYQRGSDAELDYALGIKPAMEEFLKQEEKQSVSFEATLEALKTVFVQHPQPQRNPDFN